MTMQLSQLRRPFPRILALEVEENVIDKLQDSLPGLRCCALVCRAWYIRSRRYLLYRITVNTVGDVDRLCTYFDTHPGLKSLVSLLHIWPRMYPSRCLDIVWIPLAFRLPGLRELSLSGPAGWHTPSYDISFHRATLTGLQYSHLSLERLQVNRITFGRPQALLCLLVALPSLRNLEVINLNFVHVNAESARQAILRRSQKVNVKRVMVSVPMSTGTLWH